MKRGASIADLRRETSTEFTDDCVAGSSVNNSNSQPKSKKSKRGRGITAEQSNAIDDTFDRVMSQVASSPAASVIDTETDTQTARGDELEAQLKQQQAVMKSLEQKIDFLVGQLQRVCDFLGLSAVGQSVQSNTPLPVHQTGACSVIADVLPTGAELANSDTLITLNSQHQKPKANPQQQQQQRHQDNQDNQTIKDIVFEAIFKESNDRAKRAKSVIISGIQVSAEFHDNDLVRQLIRSEFNFDFAPSELNCRRPGDKTPEHIQPLLVTLPSSEDAAWLVASAKQLRNSQSSWIRDNVFINRNLSRAERRLAYEQRCKRRAKQQSGQDGPTPTDSNHLAGHSEHRHQSQNNVVVADSGQAIRVVINSRRLPVRNSSSSGFVRLPVVDVQSDRFNQAFPALSRDTCGSNTHTCTATTTPVADPTESQRSDEPVIASSAPATTRTLSSGPLPQCPGATDSPSCSQLDGPGRPQSASIV